MCAATAVARFAKSAQLIPDSTPNACLKIEGTGSNEGRKRVALELGDRRVRALSEATLGYLRSIKTHFLKERLKKKMPDFLLSRFSFPSSVALVARR